MVLPIDEAGANSQLVHYMVLRWVYNFDERYTIFVIIIGGAPRCSDSQEMPS